MTRESYNLPPQNVHPEKGPSAEVREITFVIAYSPEATARLKGQSNKRIGSAVLTVIDSQKPAKETANEAEFKAPDWEQLIAEMNAAIPPLEGPFSEN